jgi:hypothetical protein
VPSCSQYTVARIYEGLKQWALLGFVITLRAILSANTQCHMTQYIAVLQTCILLCCAFGASIETVLQQLIFFPPTDVDGYIREILFANRECSERYKAIFAVCLYATRCFMAVNSAKLVHRR